MCVCAIPLSPLCPSTQGASPHSTMEVDQQKGKRKRRPQSSAASSTASQKPPPKKKKQQQQQQPQPQQTPNADPVHTEKTGRKQKKGAVKRDRSEGEDGGSSSGVVATTHSVRKKTSKKGGSDEVEQAVGAGEEPVKKRGKIMSKKERKALTLERCVSSMSGMSLFLCRVSRMLVCQRLYGRVCV